MKIQLNIIRLLSLIIAKDSYSLKLISESHTVILFIDYNNYYNKTIITFF